MPELKKKKLMLGVIVLMTAILMSGCCGLNEMQSAGKLKAPKYSSLFISSVQSVRQKIIKSDQFTMSEKSVHNDMVSDWVVWVEESQKAEGVFTPQ